MIRKAIKRYSHLGNPSISFRWAECRWSHLGHCCSKYFRLRCCSSTIHCYQGNTVSIDLVYALNGKSFGLRVGVMVRIGVGSGRAIITGTVMVSLDLVNSTLSNDEYT
ncbi:hypothetical protein H105_07146 [Trichophyton soudanense CBS 452.61]|uniref:Uncharacterized protein n=1 Tax=Trichophyton soudanense CBS 452.61 TaxID=1215331 RepID=A0A022XJH7_TRISD|nr:hypothetical protein H105_07146 [Trichophyton soudanense CBS 452.61]EZG03522.1 hypothetical protein H106_06973 [Trichophyton rubrum CBS 735.88]